MEHIQQWGDKLEAKTNLHTGELYHNKSHLCVGCASLTHAHNKREGDRLWNDQMDRATGTAAVMPKISKRYGVGR